MGDIPKIATRIVADEALRNLEETIGNLVRLAKLNRKGKPLGKFKHSWTSACIKAGLPGRLMHNFQRTTVRNLVRAGIPERVAMKMTGHKTRWLS